MLISCAFTAKLINIFVFSHRQKDDFLRYNDMVLTESHFVYAFCVCEKNGIQHKRHKT